MATKFNVSILIYLAIAGVGFIGWVLPGQKADSQVSLGVWKNMPSAQTELMGNTSYRTIVTATGGFAGITAGLTADCIVSSNTVGAKLTLQYALFSLVSNTNTTNFQSTGSVLFIDAVTNPTCLPFTSNPGSAATFASLNATSSGGYVFRVIGSGGGGVGDNPRFSSVDVELSEAQERIFMPIALGISTTQFNGFVYASIPESSNTVVNFQWVATNTTVLVASSVQHGSNTCTITVATNNIRCNVVTVFGTAFIGTPNVVMTMTTPGVSVPIPVGTLSFLKAQTLTV